MEFLLFGRGNKLQVDMGDLLEEKERLTNFIEQNLKVRVDSSNKKLAIDSDKVSSQELKHLITKFVYRRNLNATHWVSLDGETIKIKRFKNAIKKTKKSEKNKKEPAHQTITQSWGL